MAKVSNLFVHHLDYQVGAPQLLLTAHLAVLLVIDLFELDLAPRRGAFRRENHTRLCRALSLS